MCKALKNDYKVLYDNHNILKVEAWRELTIQCINLCHVLLWFVIDMYGSKAHLHPRRDNYVVTIHQQFLTFGTYSFSPLHSWHHFRDNWMVCYWLVNWLGRETPQIIFEGGLFSYTNHKNNPCPNFYIHMYICHCKVFYTPRV